MKIVIDLTSLDDNLSGIERFASNIAYELVKNHENDEYILIFKNKIDFKFVEFQKRQNVRLIVLRGRNKLVFSQIILPLELYKHKADYYLFMAFPEPMLFNSKNSITTIHDIGCWDYPEAMKVSSKYYFRILYRKAVLGRKQIMTVSNFTMNRIHEKLNVPKDRIWVINNGLSDVFRNFKYSSEEEKLVMERYGLPSKYILCLSTLEPRKNLRLLVDAYCELRRNNMINYDLVLAGRKGWKMDDFLSKLDDDIYSHIHITGFVEDRDLPYIYRNAGCFVFPSLYEGFGIPPIEALSMDTPVISSDSSSLPEVLGDYAIYFKNDDKEDLKRKIMLWHTEGIHKDNIGNISQRYVWSQQADKLYCHLKVKRGI